MSFDTRESEHAEIIEVVKSATHRLLHETVMEFQLAGLNIIQVVDGEELLPSSFLQLVDIVGSRVR